MLSPLINRFKQIRKDKFLDMPDSYSGKYAFIGVGNHSFSNLYPCIQQLAVPLKWICTTTPDNAERMAKRFSGCKGTAELNDILHDDEVKGVFICANPDVHFKLTQRVMEAGKHVFVEKPPCKTDSELNTLVGLAHDKVNLVGLQRRYSKAGALLRKKSDKALSYNYKYLTGAYPEGDPVFDLFIHPVDFMIFLFGAVKDVQFHRVGQKGHQTIQAMLTHGSGVKGVMELSTQHSWKMSRELLEINTDSESIVCDLPYEIVTITKSKRVMGVPLEKVFSSATEKKELLKENGFVPIAENNTLVVQGFYDEIKTFTDLVEGRKADNRTSFRSLKDTFEVLRRIES